MANYALKCSACGASKQGTKKQEGQAHADLSCFGVWQLVNYQPALRRAVEIDTRPDYWKRLNVAHTSKWDVLDVDRNPTHLREFLALSGDPVTKWDTQGLDSDTILAYDGSPDGEQALLIKVRSVHTRMFLALLIGIRQVTGSWMQAA